MLEFSIICRSAELLDKINNILWSVKTKYGISVDYSGSIPRSFLVGGSDSAPPGAWFGLLNPPFSSFFSCFVCYPSNDRGLVLVLSTNIENIMLVVDSPTRTSWLVDCNDTVVGKGTPPEPNIVRSSINGGYGFCPSLGTLIGVVDIDELFALLVGLDNFSKDGCIVGASK